MVMTREEEMIQAGWEKMGIYDEPKLSELVEMYREIGFEVHLDPFGCEQGTDCRECMRQAPEKYKILYTRRKEGA